MDFFLQAPASCPKPTSQREVERSLWYIQLAPRALIALRLQLCFLMIGSAFVSTCISIGNKQSKIPCLGLSSRLCQNQAVKDLLPWIEFKAFLKRVWVTQKLLCIPLGVVLDKTPRTSKRKFAIGRLTLSILNPSSLMLTELQKT